MQEKIEKGEVDIEEEVVVEEVVEEVNIQKSAINPRLPKRAFLPAGGSWRRR